jgi:ribosome-associated protein
LVETKRGTKRASSGTTSTKTSAAPKKRSAAGARPLIHSSHGKGASRSAADAGDGLVAAPSAGKRTTRLSVSKAKDGPPKAARPKISDGPAPRVRKGKSPAATSSESVASDAARELAVAIATAALDKKAVGLEVLDVAGKVDYADFLVLMTGRSDRQVQALAQGIEAALRDQGKRPLSVEGLPHASWVLMDFGDVVVHVFQEDARSSYDLDGLWMDARRIPLQIPEELR